MTVTSVKVAVPAVVHAVVIALVVVVVTAARLVAVAFVVVVLLQIVLGGRDVIPVVLARVRRVQIMAYVLFQLLAEDTVLLHHLLPLALVLIVVPSRAVAEEVVWLPLALIVSIVVVIMQPVVEGHAIQSIVAPPVAVILPVATEEPVKNHAVLKVWYKLVPHRVKPALRTQVEELAPPLLLSLPHSLPHVVFITDSAAELVIPVKDVVYLKDWWVVVHILIHVLVFLPDPPVTLHTAPGFTVPIYNLDITEDALV